MQLETIWIILAVILLILELWAINVVLRSTGGWETKGLWLIILYFRAAVRADCLGLVRAKT